MDRINTPAIETATGATAEVYAQIRKSIGSVPNLFVAVGAHGPEALKAVLAAEGVLASGTLDKKDQETIKLLVSVLTGCDYCEAAHTVIGKMVGLPQDVIGKIRRGESTGDAKRDALIRLVRTLIQTSGTIPAEEFAAIKEAGYTDRQLVEISFAISLVIFTNVFNRINDTTVDFPVTPR
ncbi:MAG TPA: carboxymuconolactone decarboxylase family protein [Oxalicibacterium sp.]|uniref:carboxymuconolactone decarboxylase family protein n=1 Tax=Oxalicibacterium sp. TaxID=2766525 RepID=UPI002BED96AD|nr:carboxymuconolactone decarboxylase family protein [Oxalicibacterium sp.]HWU97734.1 carboxymuconolactone decarboxylase family protein [Oxalicibacterium sp.]